MTSLLGDAEGVRFVVAALLFDIDGTLVDSTSVVERIWRTWAGRRGLDAEAILAVCHGRRSEDTIADFLPIAERSGATRELEALELEDVSNVIALPATKDLLAGLPSDRWAAVTSGSRRLMKKRLAAAGLPVPDVLVGAGDVTIGKPHPEGYLAAAAALGVESTDCLVVEDAPAGVAAGRAAGARVLAVATSHDASALTGADAVVADLRDVAVVPAERGLRVHLRTTT